jgi:hypothetical protein
MTRPSWVQGDAPYCAVCSTSPARMVRVVVEAVERPGGVDVELRCHGRIERVSLAFSELRRMKGGIQLHGVAFADGGPRLNATLGDAVAARGHR